jgi:hypothetical protein
MYPGGRCLEMAVKTFRKWLGDLDSEMKQAVRKGIVNA